MASTDQPTPIRDIVDVKASDHPVTVWFKTEEAALEFAVQVTLAMLRHEEFKLDNFQTACEDMSGIMLGAQQDSKDS